MPRPRRRPSRWRAAVTSAKAARAMPRPTAATGAADDQSLAGRALGLSRAVPGAGVAAAVPAASAAWRRSGALSGAGSGIVHDHGLGDAPARLPAGLAEDRKSTRLNSSHVKISYAVF